MKLFFGLITSLVAITGCSKSISIDKNYKGVINSPKILIERLKLESDETYVYYYSAFDAGEYAYNTEYIGKYKIRKEQIKFSLDTIKSFDTKMYKLNEKREDNPYSNHKISVVNSEQKERFKLGRLRLKPRYSIDKNHKLIRDKSQERFILDDVPIPKRSKHENELKNEIEELNKIRNTNLKNLIDIIVKECKLNAYDSLFLRVVVKPNGKIETYDLIDINSNLRTDDECVKNLIHREFQNLGEHKIIPNARNGTRAHSITYTLPIK